MKTETMKLKPKTFAGYTYADELGNPVEKPSKLFCSQRLFFNKKLIEVQMVEPGVKWFDNPKQYYQVWGIRYIQCGDGMNDVPRIMADELIFETPFGNYRIRESRSEDKGNMIYGVNNYNGVFMEPIQEKAKEDKPMITKERAEH
jgi:hypothetical protein